MRQCGGHPTSAVPLRDVPYGSPMYVHPREGEGPKPLRRRHHRSSCRMADGHRRRRHHTNVLQPQSFLPTFISIDRILPDHMLTIIGTGHVFNISDPISFIVRQCWPQAVCVELDDMRYHALTGDKEALRKDLEARGIDPDASKEERLKQTNAAYQQSAKYQEKMSAQNKSTAGADMVAAIGAGKSCDAEIFCIDKDASATMDRMWTQMGRGERMRYRLSGISDSIFGKRKVDRTQKDYSKDQAAYIEEMRKRYPTMVRVLIDERNEFMASKIKEVCATHDRVVVVVGDGHVDGLLKLLPEEGRRVVRLVELMDPERVKQLKTQYWEGVEE